MILLFLTGAIIGSLANSIDLEKRGLCPAYYVSGPRESCFRFVEDRKTFDEARRQCEIEGGTLANTQSHEVYEFVRQRIESNHDKAPIHYGLFGIPSMFTPWNMGWWVGARKEGNWKWLDGEGVGGRWANHRPDNWMGNENCLEQMSGDKGWNDIKCEDKLRFVCQRSFWIPAPT